MREKSVGAIVFTKKDFETNFLLLHYTTGHWDFPKGHVESNETEEETLWREFEEETGIAKEQTNLFPNFRERITYFYKKQEQAVFKEVIFYLVESKTDKVKLSPEHTEFLWLPFERAVKRATFENTREILKKAHSVLSQKALGENQ
ncbi:MAG: NUDIX domain-containing protein [Candidatus Diapherotrites archaeon]|nr:NUDIX domain-containing protein [Candidatus Diapherotrites archaeon]